MKRYLLFAGDQHYPRGGWKDLVGQFDTNEEALTRLRTLPQLVPKDWWHIVDTFTGTISNED